MNAHQRTAGLIGCGQLGRGLARNLLAAGWTVLAHDVNDLALQAVVDLGARAMADVDAVAAGARLIVTCLPDLDTIEAVYRGGTGGSGLLSRCAPGTLLIDTSSNRPATARELADLASQHGLGLVDAPLIGMAQDAWDGTLTILASGADEHVAAAQPLLQSVAQRVLQVGGPGHAHVLKSLNNSVAMVNHAIVCEVFAVAEELGIGLEQVLEVLRSGYGASRKLEDLAPKLLGKNHPRRAVMATVAKDMQVFKEVSLPTSVLTPVLDSTLAMYASLCKFGADREPPSRLADLLRADSGVLASVMGARHHD